MGMLPVGDVAVAALSGIGDVSNQIAWELAFILTDIPQLGGQAISNLLGGDREADLNSVLVPAILDNPNALGAIRAIAGLEEVALGLVLLGTPLAPVAPLVIAQGISEFAAGLETAITGEPVEDTLLETAISSTLEFFGVDADTAESIGEWGDLGVTIVFALALLSRVFDEVPMPKDPPKYGDEAVRAADELVVPTDAPTPGNLRYVDETAWARTPEFGPNTVGAAQPPRYIPDYGWTDADYWHLVKQLQNGESIEVPSLRLAAELRQDAFPDYVRTRYRGPLSEAPKMEGTYDWHDPAKMPHSGPHTTPHIQIKTDEGTWIRIEVK
jgi:hypothetical protein